MKRDTLKIALILSLVLNICVLGAASVQLARGGSFAIADRITVADSLRLDDEQRRRWLQTETGFRDQFRESWDATGRHRETLIRAIFSDQPDMNVIEAERNEILRLLAKQQQRVIAQLLAKRDILDREQRTALAELLLKQEPPATVDQLLRRE